MTRTCPDCRQTEWHLISCPRSKEPVAVGTRVGEEFEPGPTKTCPGCGARHNKVAGWYEACLNNCPEVEKRRPNLNPAPAPAADMVNHPPHYNAVPGIECWAIRKYLTSGGSDAFKYLWRCDEKGAAATDLRKALWYLENTPDDSPHAQVPEKAKLLLERAVGHFPYHIGAALIAIVDNDYDFAEESVRAELARRAAE